VFGGGNKYLVDLITAIENDFDVFILTNKNGFFEANRKELSNVVIHSRPVFKVNVQRFSKHPRLKWTLNKCADLILPFILVLNIISFLFYLKKAKPQLSVSCNGGYPAAESTLAMVIASRLLRIPVIVSIVSLPVKRRKLLWLYDFLLDKLVTKSVRKIIVNSKAQMLALKKVRGFREDKIVCIHNGIEDLPGVKRSKYSLQKEISSLALGYVGRLDKLKGVEYILQAMAHCKEQNNSRLILVGEGPEMDYLMRLTSSLGLNNRVEFRGFVKESIATIHSDFDVFVFPSLWEGLPYSILEAMRSGLPVITTNVGGIPEAITHLENGILVEPANVKQLSEAIDLIAKDDLLSKFSKNARIKFETEFTLNIMHQKFRGLVENNINRNKFTGSE
jgi:glycosyltransferase involved in cell wall biosynthesis